MNKTASTTPFELSESDLSLARGGGLTNGDYRTVHETRATSKIAPTQDSLLSLEEVDDI